MVPTLTATLGVKGHRLVVGTWDCKHLLYVFAVVNLVTAAIHANTLESPTDAKKQTGKSKTRRMQTDWSVGGTRSCGVGGLGVGKSLRLLRHERRQLTALRFQLSAREGRYSETPRISGDSRLLTGGLAVDIKIVPITPSEQADVSLALNRIETWLASGPPAIMALTRSTRRARPGNSLAVGPVRI
ncbi:hypothetical protein [Urbifossiella limnaea]|uniref:hypothetical protein n=1 Tax=Urbifossiella limnaea TaxID=2528023 RepID=UPI00192E5D21|nr:hypothetical protein [Urbifossiella limnaea]